jgi:hypothetical protein
MHRHHQTPHRCLGQKLLLYPVLHLVLLLILLLAGMQL